MRVSATLLAAAIFAAPAFAEKEASGPMFEPNTYRYGGTYSIVVSQSPTQCARACGGDTSCMAWSFVDLPGASTRNACELKGTLGRAEMNPTATSGISPRLEKGYQPSKYLNVANRSMRTVRAAPSAPSTVTSRAPARRYAPAAPATISSSSRSPLYKTPPAAPATISSQAPKRISAPSAPATVSSQPPIRRAVPAAPAVVSSATKIKAPVAAPTAQRPALSDRSAPITVNTAPRTVSAPSGAPATVQFQPLKRSADGTYRPVTSKAATPKQPSSRIVLTGPKGDDVARAVHGRVVLKGDMTGPDNGGVGETPAAPIPRNVPVNTQGERVPYKDIGSREFPDYSVTRAAEQGMVDSIGMEETGSSLPVPSN